MGKIFSPKMPSPKVIQIAAWVKSQVSPYRFQHIQGVVLTSEKLARKYGLPAEKAVLAAWLHDSAKEWSRGQMRASLSRSLFKLDSLEKTMPGLWHPHAGAAAAVQKWGIRDKDVLQAIRCHTLGHARMRPLAQVVFVADFIEPGREFAGVVTARQAARTGLREAVAVKAAMTLQFLLERKMKIHPRLVETWNSFLERDADEKSE